MPTCNSQILELDTNECVQNYENEFLGHGGARGGRGAKGAGGERAWKGLRVWGFGFRVFAGGLGIRPSGGIKQLHHCQQ